MESGMYLYPWEIDDMGHFTAEYTATGCTGMAAALSYHHAHAFMARSGRFKTFSDAAVCFTPTNSLYGRIKPAVRSGVQAKQVRDWCAKVGKKFSAWTVLLHNSTLGAAHPDLCVENCAGDRYEHALCPSNADVRDYIKALLADIVAQFAPDSMMLESLTTPPVQHGLHHEIANIALSPSLRWLLSLCFCPACMARSIPGLDPEAARVQAQDLVKYLANHEATLDGGDAQVTMLLLERPDLYAYQQARQRDFAALADEVAAQLRAAHTEFCLIPSATPFTIPNAYIEGMSFSAFAGKADRLLPLVYGANETYDLVCKHIRAFDSKTPIGMATTLHPARFANKDAFLAAVTAAKSAACETFYVYNYTLASAERLGWVRDMNKILMGGA